MIKKDYHGWLVEDAVRDVELLVGRARMNDPVLAEFITGNSVIKKAILRVLDDYGLEGEEKWGNVGAITVMLQ